MPQINVSGRGGYPGGRGRGPDDPPSSFRKGEPLDLKRVMRERELQMVGDSLDKLFSSLKKINLDKIDRLKLEELGSKRVFKMEEDLRREKEKQLRQQLKEERDQARERTRQSKQAARDREIFFRDLSIGGLVGAVTGRKGGFTGLAKEVGGFAAGGLAGAAGAGRFSAGIIAEVVSEAIGFLMNPMHAAMSAAKPAIDFQLGAYRLGRLSGFGGARMEELLSPSLGSAGIPTWMKQLGMGPSSALTMGQQFGLPISGDPGQMLRMLRILELQPSLQGLAPGTTTGLMSKIVGMGVAPGSAAGVESTGSAFMRAFTDANMKGFDASKVAGAMDASLDIIARSTVPMAASISGLTRLLSIGIATGTPQGATGASTLQSVQGMAQNLANPTQNPMLMTAMMTLAPKFNNFRSAGDINRFLGPNAAAAANNPLMQWEIAQAAALAQKGQIVQAINTILPLAGADPANLAKNVQSFAGSAVGNMSPLTIANAISAITGLDTTTTRGMMAGLGTGAGTGAPLAANIEAGSDILSQSFRRSRGGFGGYNRDPTYENSIWGRYFKRFHQAGGRGAEGFNSSIGAGGYYKLLTSSGVPPEIAQDMVSSGQRHGVSPMVLAAVADQESHMNANIGMVVGRNKRGQPTYDYGLMQINNANWGRYPGAGPGGLTNPTGLPGSTFSAQAEAEQKDLQEAYASLKTLVPATNKFSTAVDAFAQAVSQFVGIYSGKDGAKQFLQHFLDGHPGARRSMDLGAGLFNGPMGGP